MKNFNRWLIAGLLTTIIPASTSAQSLGLNFAATDPNAATSSLAASDVAGVVPAANWNNLLLNTGSSGSLVYSDGSAAAGVSVTWSSPNTWRSGGNNAFPVGPDRILTSGYLDTGNTAENGISITVGSLAPGFTSSGYNVYVYFVSDSGADRGGGYTINDGLVNILKYGSTMASPSSFIEDPGTDVDNSIDGTYLAFLGLTGGSFTLTSDATLTTPNGFRAPINAIQIVAVPEPTAAALLGGGLMLFDFIARRRKA